MSLKKRLQHIVLSSTYINTIFIVYLYIHNTITMIFVDIFSIEPRAQVKFTDPPINFTVYRVKAGE